MTQSVWREAHGYEDPPEPGEVAAGVLMVIGMLTIARLAWRVLRRPA